MTNSYLSENFTTIEHYQELKEKSLRGPNGWLLFVACNAGMQLASDIRQEYEGLYHEREDDVISIPLIGTHEEPLTRIFTDLETCPRLPIHVAGANAFVFQNTHEYVTPYGVNENIQQLIQVVRTLRTHRAQTITVVLPYSAYSRQDKPSFMKREAALASLFADQLKISGADMYLTYHPHTLSLYGFYEPEIKFVALSGLDLFESFFKKFKNLDDTIVVSTDAGGAKATIYFAESLGVPYAISSKLRDKKDHSDLIGIIGDLTNKKRAIIIDDETVTGNSIINTVKAVNQKFGIEEIYAAVTHFKVNNENIGKFIDANKNYGLKELHITDSIPQKKEILDHKFVIQHSLAGVFATTINKLHYNQSVSRIFSRL